VQVSKQLFPSVALSVKEATSWLLEERRPHAFISADECLNAACIPGPDDLPLIWISSGLVKCLNDRELRFVIGHELGHWYYEHYRYPEVAPDWGPKFAARQQLSRAAEISADRFGLIACRDVDVALRAIVKTASGLGDEFLGKRVAEFIAQARSIKKVDIDAGEVFATHPPMVIRARGLLWFSMSDLFSGFIGLPDGGLDIQVVNERVEKDLSSALGERFTEKQSREVKDALLWMTLHEMLEDGSLTRREQKLIESFFGRETVLKVKAFIKDKTVSGICDELRERAVEAHSLLAAYPINQVQSLIAADAQIAEHAVRFMNRFS